MADGRFEKVYSQNMGIATGIEILRDKTTGVNYIFNYAGNRGGLTVLLDENGKPVITK